MIRAPQISHEAPASAGSALTGAVVAAAGRGRGPGCRAAAIVVGAAAGAPRAAGAGAGSADVVGVVPWRGRRGRRRAARGGWVIVASTSFSVMTWGGRSVTKVAVSLLPSRKSDSMTGLAVPVDANAASCRSGSARTS